MIHSQAVCVSAQYLWHINSDIGRANKKNITSSGKPVEIICTRERNPGKMASTSTPSSSASGSSRKYIPPALRSQQAPASASTSSSSSSRPNGSTVGSRTSTQPPWPTAHAPYQQPTRRDDRHNTGQAEAGPSTRWNGSQDTYRRSGPGHPQPQPHSSAPYDYGREDESMQSRGNRFDSHSTPTRSAYIPPSQRVPPHGHSYSQSQSHSAPSPRRRYIPESAHLFLAGDSFVGALSPAKGPQPKEMPSERGETEDEKEEYAVLKKEWEVYDAIPKMIKIRKEKGAAAKVGFLTRARIIN